LVKQAEEQQKPPEQLAREKLLAELGMPVSGKAQANRIAKDFLASCIGGALVPQTPSFDEERSVWQVHIAIELLAEGWTEVGTLEIDASTGYVLTEAPSFSALFQRFRELVGIEDFPADKQARLSKLLELNNDGALTLEQRNELNLLMNEADAQEALNLQRLANRLPDRKKI